MKQIEIKIEKSYDFVRFLSMSGFSVEDLGNDIYSVQRDEELPVYVKVDDEVVYFEVDLGNVSSIASQDLYFKFLDLNTEILPVSLGINNANPEDPRLVLVESRETSNLNDHEILSVFDAMELAVEKIEPVLHSFVATNV